MEIAKQIQKLKKEKNAIVLAHNYVNPEIQDIADFVGDSFELAQQAEKTNADVIVFCGVDFMAETAKILNPKKIVLMPDLNAGCPMADMLPADAIRSAKKKYPNAEVILYINTKAEAKAEADYVCTSANADKVVNAARSEVILFGPDANLAEYVKKKTSKKIISIPANGCCPIHNQMLRQDVLDRMKEHPNAKFIVHPETKQEIQKLADEVLSTGGMLRYCKNSPCKEFIIGTENGIIYRMKKENPGKIFYPVSENMICPDMKKNSLKGVLKVLKEMKPQVEVPKEVAEKALKSIKKMLEII